MQMSIEMLQQFQRSGIKHIRVSATATASHVLHNLLQHEKVAVSTEVSAKITNATDEGEHNMAGGNHLADVYI
jgi:hypothetical protein